MASFFRKLWPFAQFFNSEVHSRSCWPYSGNHYGHYFDAQLMKLSFRENIKDEKSRGHQLIIDSGCLRVFRFASFPKLMSLQKSDFNLPIRVVNVHNLRE